VQLPGTSHGGREMRSPGTMTAAALELAAAPPLDVNDPAPARPADPTTAPAPAAAATEPPAAPAALPYQITAQRIAGADPHLPDAVKRRLRGQPEHSFVTQICVGSDGAVTDVSVLQGIAGADDSLVATLRQWRYVPQPIPVCFVTQLVFSVE
jgi:hypothetical protein